MRKLRFRRRAVSTMIGGMIILGLFLSAIAAMILLSYQFDSYQTTVNKMQQADSERFSENLQPKPPAISLGEAFSISCAGSQTCNNYTMTLTNLGTGLQVARIYINSSKSPGCTTFCVLDPSTDASPSSFSASDRYINPSESKSIALWLPGNAGRNITLPADEYGLNTITIVTTRGRVFAFQWPIPPLGPGSGSGGGPGGTGLYIGPLVIVFQKQLIAYTYNNSGRVNFPIGGTNGHWAIPGRMIVFYFKIQTDVGTPDDVYLTPQSVFELAQYDNSGGPGNVVSLFIIAPIGVNFCQNGFASKDSEIRCDPAYGYYSGGTNGDPEQMGTAPSRIIPYLPCNVAPDQYNSLNCASYGPRYLIPKPTIQQLINGQRGSPVIVAFAAKVAGSAETYNAWGGFEPDTSATSFLGLTYVYQDYTYGVTLPFVAVCIQNPPSNPAQCSG